MVKGSPKGGVKYFVWSRLWYFRRMEITLKPKGEIEKVKRQLQQVYMASLIMWSDLSWFETVSVLSYQIISLSTAVLPAALWWSCFCSFCSLNSLIWCINSAGDCTLYSEQLRLGQMCICWIILVRCEDWKCLCLDVVKGDTRWFFTGWLL